MALIESGHFIDMIHYNDLVSTGVFCKYIIDTVAMGIALVQILVR